MKIRMLKPHLDNHGIWAIYLRAGEKYNLPDQEAMKLISQGYAEQDQDRGGSPEIKQIQGVNHG